MDINELTPWIESAKSAIATLKLIKDLLPSGAKREEAEKLIAKAEHDLRLADAALARDLGYGLCFRHFPPGILLEEDGDVLRCHTCGKPPTESPRPQRPRDF